ncbi:Pentulose kinase [Fomitiporia mediterranea MF3/22]|uniref:Pentulose kinase n=1 Tax=Fomitiporia mediterranea (strain MF3/22) TaxID=694068 RepID=UPI0004407635|nr:Pentulose kinase [Fomitiporia mediterranea MF3/22]EJD00891.1 Pentulose kinase [Fomitiporia mediterranea MF3/22]
MSASNTNKPTVGENEPLYIGIDVGTGSVRAALVAHSGGIVASATKETKTFRASDDHRIFEQSTTDIWDAICLCVAQVLGKDGKSKIDPARVKGIGFDATCSLAVTDLQGNPVTVTKGEDLGKVGERNIILWADHRAEEEAKLINSTGSVVLDYVGGVMSLEMEIPKTLWLKKHMDNSLFSRCQFFDLPDFLTYRATDEITRSACSITCKCSYVPDKGEDGPAGWQDSFFEQIGLGEFIQNNYAQLGPVKDSTKKNRKKTDTLTAGLPVGKGLGEKAAKELGLLTGTPVGSAVIDAYAGWVGTIAAKHSPDSAIATLETSRHRLAPCAGTSTCFIVQSPEGVFVPGVWGPYKDAVFPGWWMNEGGQSSTGQLIDFMITTHAAYPQLKEIAENEKTSIHIVLANELERQRKEKGFETLTELTKDMHLYPDLHGNRSPIADPEMRGSITGLQLDSSLHDLARKFHLTLESIALQTRHIVDSMNTAGHQISELYMSGGQAKNAKLMQLFADVVGMPVVLPESTADAVSRGSAMLARFARERQEGNTKQDLLWDIMVEMTPSGTLVSPAASPREKKLLEAKYKIFLESIEIQKRWRKEIAAASA